MDLKINRIYRIGGSGGVIARLNHIDYDQGFLYFKRDQTHPSQDVLNLVVYGLKIETLEDRGESFLRCNMDTNRSIFLLDDDCQPVGEVIIQPISVIPDFVLDFSNQWMRESLRESMHESLRESVRESVREPMGEYLSAFSSNIPPVEIPRYEAGDDFVVAAHRSHTPYEGVVLVGGVDPYRTTNI